MLHYTFRGHQWTDRYRHLASVTRLGDFWKFLAKNFDMKVPKIFDNLLGYYKKHLRKNYCGFFLANLWKLWATLYSIIWSHCTLLTCVLDRCTKMFYSIIPWSLSIGNPIVQTVIIGRTFHASAIISFKI